MNLEAIYKLALKLSKHLRVGYLSEDLAQSVVLGFLENPAKKQSVKHALIDAIRKETHSGKKSCDIFSVSDFSPENFTEISMFYKEKPISVLKDIWGYTLKEIAFMYNLSEGRISQKYYEERRTKKHEQ